jgi:uncharacterized protein (DUF924 family)
MHRLVPIASAAFVIVISILFYQYQMSLRAAILNKSIWNASLYKSVREVWFTDMSLGATCPREEDVQRWFTASAEAKGIFDRLCHSQFYSALESIDASNFSLKGYDAAEPFIAELRNERSEEDRANTALSLVILLDQIPRNIFRTKYTLPLVYNHYDPIALSVLKSMLKINPRPDLHPSLRASPVRRQWFYMPLMHSEDVGDHKLFDEIVGEIDREVIDDEGGKRYLENFKGQEKRHRTIVDKFGRYPHRNRFLERKSTEEEERYMKDGGATFGVVK